MNIAFFITEDYSFMYPLLNTLLHKLKNKHRVVGIAHFPDTIVGLAGMQIPLKYLEIFGVVTTAKLAVQNIKDRLSVPSFGQMIRNKSIRYAGFNTPNDEEVIRWIKNIHVDIILIFIGNILKKDIVEAPRCCIINKHASVLPSNRGILPVFWAMLNDERIGFTLHKVTEQLDSGEVLFQREYGKENLSLYEWYKRIYADLPDAILHCIERAEMKTTPLIVNPNVVPSYNSLPERKDVKRFYQKGRRIT
jgi:methionyl-tRNA formyltransferase